MWLYSKSNSKQVISQVKEVLDGEVKTMKHDKHQFEIPSLTLFQW